MVPATVVGLIPPMTSIRFEWGVSRGKPGSTIIASTSEQATDPTPDLYAYAQTKAATTNFVCFLGKQLAQKGIRVNGVAPGPI
ncbi:hypothetical protein EKPJFOCH_1329 [Methylobacterium thuringiense]|uniref:SDR family oxidoreductase n=1 Tax=Methylobacterium thuringiense TaxID=1003091 RepID=A0ABQ4TKQ4_9HYPH|nr:hypothetical protein EKPJFOCH_1329 [Methylobacterium thuringiense]